MKSGSDNTIIGHPERRREYSEVTLVKSTKTDGILSMESNFVFEQIR